MEAVAPLWMGSPRNGTRPAFLPEGESTLRLRLDCEAIHFYDLQTVSTMRQTTGTVH